MKKLLSIIFAPLFFTMAFSQYDENTTLSDSYYDKTQKGYIINLNWERIPCEIQLKHPAALGEELVLTTKADGKSSYKPDELIGFSVNGDLWLTKTIPGPSSRFCRILRDGNILLYERISYIRTGDMTMKRESQLTSNKYVEKEGEKWSPFSTFYFGLKYTLYPLVSDKPGFIDQIISEGPVYSEATVQNYLSLYNDWYLTQHPGYKKYIDRVVEKVAEQRVHPIAGITLEEALANYTKGSKESLAEKVNKYDKIPVYFLKDKSNIQSDAFDSNGRPFAKEDWMSDFPPGMIDNIYDFIVAEMNYLFKTDKFVRAEDFPGTKYDFAGQGINMYAQIQVYGRYQSSDINSKNEYTISYTMSHEITYMELTDKGKFQKAGQSWGSEKCKKTNANKIYGLPSYTNFIDPTCPFEGFRNMIKIAGTEWIVKQFPAQ